MKEEQLSDLHNMVKMEQVNCTVLESGYKLSDMEYYFCNCDTDQKSPICEECAKICHPTAEGHVLSEIKNVDKKERVLCECGMRGHKFDSGEINLQYEPKCYFYEISTNLKIGYYYQLKEQSFCLFCYNFCLDEHNKTEVVKQTTKSIKDYSRCDCDLKHHKDIKQIYKCIGIMLEPGFNFENLYAPKLLNLFCLCRKLWSNLFISFENYSKKLEENIKSPNFEFESNIKNSNYFYALKTISKIALKNKGSHLNYYSKSIQDFFNKNLFLDMLSKKFDNDNVAILYFRSTFLNCVQRITIDSDFSSLPKLKIFDLENMSPFQRLIFITNAKSVKSMSENYLNQNNLIEKLITSFGNFMKGRFTKILAYESIFKMTNILKKFAKFNLFTNEQKLRFCVFVEEFFSKNIEFKNKYVSKKGKNIEEQMRNYEISSLSDIAKTLLCFAIYYNDQLILNTFSSQNRNQKINFFHAKNDVGTNVLKNCILLLNFIKSDLENHGSDLQIKKILDLSTKLMSLSLDDKDFYLVGLKRSALNRRLNISSYMKLFQTNLEESEKDFVLFIQERSIEIESHYSSYFNFQMNFKQLSKHFYEIIDYCFEQFGEFSIPHLKTDEECVKSSARKSINREPGQSKNHMYQFQLKRSFFVFSVVKIICIFKKETEQISKNEKEESKLFDSILKFLYFYVNDDADNCVIALSSEILKGLTECSGKNCERVLTFIHYCIKVIVKNQYELSTTIKWLEASYKCFKNSLETGFEFNCLNLLLKILKTLLLDLPTLSHNTFINQTRGFIKTLLAEAKLILAYKDYIYNLGMNLANEKDSKIIKKQEGENNSDDKSDKITFKSLTNKKSIVLTLDVGGCKISLAQSIFLKFLRVTNDCFDDNAMFNDNEFLTKFIPEEECVIILVNKSLNLDIRTEILRFFRMVYVDVTIAPNKMNEYISEFCSEDSGENEETKIDLANLRVFNFLAKIMTVSGTVFDSDIEYLILLRELMGFQTIFEKSHESNSKAYLNYFENGIILTLKIYLKKIFSQAYVMEGIKFLKIYKLTVYILKMKEYLLSNEFEKENKKNKHGFESKPVWEKQVIKSLIIENFSDKELKEVRKDLLIMQSDNFQPLDYLTIYDLISKHFFEFIASAKVKSESSVDVGQEFNEEKKKILNKSLKEYGYKSNDIEAKLLFYDLVINYTKSKSDDKCFIDNLNELHIDFAINYGEILLNYLLYLSKNAGSIFIDENVPKNANEIILKLLKKETSEIQGYIVKIYNDKKESTIVEDLQTLFIYCFKNIISVIFSSYNPSALHFSDDYLTACTLIKIFKYLCEDHNNYFQTLFMKTTEFKFSEKNENGEEVSKILTIYDMFLLILNKILILSKWEKIKSDADPSIPYFEDLFINILDLLNEVVQGNINSTFERLVPSDYVENLYIQQTEQKEQTKRENEQILYAFPIFLNSVKSLLFKDNSNSIVIYRVRIAIMNYLISFLEEKSCPKYIQQMIISSFFPQAILKSISNSMKKCYIRMTTPEENTRIPTQTIENKAVEEEEEEEEVENSEEDENQKEIDFVDNAYTKIIVHKKLKKKYKEIKFDAKIFKFFSEIYFSDKNFVNSEEFQFANLLFKYLKILSVEYEQEESRLLFSHVKEIEQLGILTNNKTTTKIGTENQENRLNEDELEKYYVIKFFENITRSVQIQVEGKSEPTRVIFTLPYMIKSLSSGSKKEFLENVDIESRYAKLISLMEVIDDFIDEIEFNFEKGKQSDFFRILYFIDYVYVEFAMFFLALILNFLLLAGAELDSSNHITYKFQSVTSGLNIAQLVLNSIFFITWILTKFRLYYIIDTNHYLKENKIEDRNQLKILEKIFAIGIYRSLFLRNEAFIITWNMAFSLIPIINSQYNYLFAIQILSMMNLSVTLKNILKVIVLRWIQLLATFLLLIVILYLFATIGYFGLHDDIWIKLGFQEESHTKEPACVTLLYCFVTTLNEGLRIRPGIGEFFNRFSYVYETSHYLKAYFYNLFFFILVIVIMLNLVFGIIIDTYKELRIENQEKEYDQANRCYICGIEKDELEKKNVNYEHHIKEDHNLWNYCYFMIGLKYLDEQDANSISSYAMDKIKKKEISWIPSLNDCFSEENEQNKEEIENKPDPNNENLLQKREDSHFK